MRPAPRLFHHATRLVRGLRRTVALPPVQIACALLLLAPFLARVVGSGGQDPCNALRLGNGWCQRQGVGYMAGVRIPSASLFEFLDPAGHGYELNGVSCPVCRKAILADGYCERDRIGYAHGLAYMTRLGYLLALADPVRPGTLGCAVCESHIQNPGWCDRCQRGILAGFSFTDRTRFEETLGRVTRLRAAVDLSSRCELCGIALFSDGRCPHCRIFYRDGHVVPPLTQARKSPS